eukprot:CAMPEP_0197479420 /NCGR_PEP_ID=MMETSP1309-20131121/33837_1 /TAXON_ID=464262 /ORGANISM="Genus nov. species nov., Strain RCC998" /LENGTH=127 /DNA_ID=CAMNT_0043021073 /DNA_START=157 /DNA_END=536 /DNA_ORIENTATION=-
MSTFITPVPSSTSTATVLPASSTLFATTTPCTQARQKVNVDSLVISIVKELATSLSDSLLASSVAFESKATRLESGPMRTFAAGSFACDKRRSFDEGELSTILGFTRHSRFVASSAALCPPPFPRLR